MPRASRLASLVALLALMASPAVAQEPIRFARTPDISPDGKLVAFSYLGDIHVVETIGGIARTVTTHPAHDINPVFSPDGQQIAFSSNRHGGYDVFVVPARGGRPRRLTFDSSPDMVCGWTPDGKQVLFSSTRGASFPPTSELYLVPVEGGRVRRVTPAEGKDGSFSPRGDQLLYVRGPGEWYRKGYRGSSNDDIWVANADGTNNRRLTQFHGQDHSPMWAADGASFFYVSEINGLANIVRQPLAPQPPSARPVSLTQHTDESVRRARISRSGEWIVYECGPDLWVVSTREGRSRKLAIEVNADDKANNERVQTFTRGATEFALSPDEKHLCFAIQGKLFRMAVGPNSRTVQLTDGASNDHGPAWSPDGSKILFISDRNGHDDLYLLETDDPDHPKFVEAHRFKITQLSDTREAESGLSFSPDGKRVAFLRGGKLWTMNPDGKDQKAVLGDVQVFDYDWSPDGRWIVFARRDGSFASELYIVPSTGATVSNPVRNITRYATYNGGVTWSADGKRLAFLSERRGAANLHIMDLEKPPADPMAAASNRPTLGGPLTWTWGTKPPLAIDWDDLHLRVRPVVRGLVDEAAISPDGSKIAFRDSNQRDLWVATADGNTVTRLTTGGVNPRQIHWSKRRSPLGSALEIIYFLDGQGNVRLCNAGSSGEGKPASERTVTLPFKVKMTVFQDKLFEEMFDQSWRFLSENFYDDKFHGRNWDDVRKTYRPLVKHVSLKEDLYAMLYLMLGELNASHLGVSGFISAPEEETADLGLLWDDTHRGKGLRIGEILKRGPADRKGITLKAGEYVVSIDGRELDESANLSQLLNGKVGEGIVLQVTDNPADPKAKRRRVELIGLGRYPAPGRSESLADLMYDRWVARNAARVAELSGGKLGYIHIPSMDDEGLDRFVRSLYSDNFDKEAIVLDVRFNGGGFTHDQVLNYLGSREHTIFKNRDGGQGLVLRAWDRKWHKPLALLINNRSYSDAEIFPNAFRTLGLGKLVGEATGGYVIGTTGMRLVDGSMFRIPRIGVYTMRGVNMEKEGVAPDVPVENHPDQLARGQDAQLERAVQVLQGDVAEWKKKRTPEVAVQPTTPAGVKVPPTPVAAPTTPPRP
ncbi:MAG: S41 family peptidase [Gemmataceae bacterium]